MSGRWTPLAEVRTAGMAMVDLVVGVGPGRPGLGRRRRGGRDWAVLDLVVAFVVDVAMVSAMAVMDVTVLDLEVAAVEPGVAIAGVAVNSVVALAPEANAVVAVIAVVDLALVRLPSIAPQHLAFVPVIAVRFDRVLALPVVARAVGLQGMNLGSDIAPNLGFKPGPCWWATLPTGRTRYGLARRARTSLVLAKL